jgi:5-methyltetrahydropteroyltriglutamate--homocysteine S-methyltransferase
LEAFFIDKEDIMMSKLSVIGYPRIGAQRELKKWTEDYFAGKLSAEELQKNAAGLRQHHWLCQKEHGVDFIPSNDFSFYDTALDTAFLLNAIPARYQALGLNPLDTYFAMAKGYQEHGRDVKALPLKKWFNTNYHYLVPALEEDMELKLHGEKPFAEYREALAFEISTKPVLIGPFTFLKLAKVESGRKQAYEYAEAITGVYQDILAQFNLLGTQWLQLDEPALVSDLAPDEIDLFETIYRKLLPNKQRLHILLQTYFGDIRDVYQQVMALDFDGVGLDFVEGTQNIDLITTNGFPAGKLLFAGLINGKNIWINDYRATLKILDQLAGQVDRDQIVLNTSCSLLHLPYSVKFEHRLKPEYRRYLAFAKEKLEELRKIARIWNSGDYRRDPEFIANSALVEAKKSEPTSQIPEIRNQVAQLTENDFTRKPAFPERHAIQQARLDLPLLPTTTIGSFPQTLEVRNLRRSYREEKTTTAQYDAIIKTMIAKVIRLQEEIGLDVLVHGEYERNDMVEYFGENLSGFLFTENGWVQSYGTRCVKPPIIFGDVRRTKPITIDTITYAQSLTSKPVKGMLTGPVTILNWSFPREDLSLGDIAYQIGLAIRKEVMDLEAAGIGIIQIDEAAFREKLPLRKEDWNDYFDWAIRAFRLTHASVRPETQIHTHMCYSEFEAIIKEIMALDADVFTFEAARSDLALLNALNESSFQMGAGPGIYDIHSPRIPEKDEIKGILANMLRKIDFGKLWVNPDCGLKTRKMEETVASLQNMVQAAKELREKLPIEPQQA